MVEVNQAVREEEVHSSQVRSKDFDSHAIGEWRRAVRSEDLRF